jgi:hypothetical protein
MTTMDDSYPITATTRLNRRPQRAHYDRATVHAILDEALVCHIGATVAGHPMAQPRFFWRIGETVFVHGAHRNGLFEALKAGAEACLTATLVDGLVLARSAFHHSMNYRSVMAFGHFQEITEPEEKAKAFKAMLDKLVPGRWPDIRPPSSAELAGTALLAMPLEEVSAKVRNGPPSDNPADMDLPVWAGVIPVSVVRGAPIAGNTESR